MSPSTTTLAWPSLASSPIRRPTPPSPFSRMRLTSSLAMASPCAPCSPITAAAIAPTSFTAFVFTWASNTAALALIRRKPMAKPNASSRPPFAREPTPLTGPTPISAISHLLPVPTTTTSSVPMVAFTTSRPSAALILVQRLDHLQAPGSSRRTGASWGRSVAALLTGPQNQLFCRRHHTGADQQRADQGCQARGGKNHRQEHELVDGRINWARPREQHAGHQPGNPDDAQRPQRIDGGNQAGFK